MTDTDREHRLEQCIADYLAAEDAGSSPDRSALLAAQPDLAAELRTFFCEYDRIGHLAAPFRAAVAAGPGPADSPTIDLSPQPLGPATRPILANTATTNDVAEPDLARGSRVHYFGDYELLEKLGQGGMGVVYKARQVSLNRPVALKMLRSGVLATDDDRRRFQNEAEAVALLDHRHVVPILEVGEHNDRRYFSMKLIGGSSLDKKLADYLADPKGCARLLATVAEAVHHAHQRGILHRDLKPSNVLLDERDTPYVTDFGLAKRVGGESELTHSGVIVGTPAYMAPEQASGRRGMVTTTTDVHGLGAILYAMLTGSAPFRGDSVMDTLQQVREWSPELPRRLNSNVPRDLEVICLKCLEKDPARRYASAQALADDLHRYLNAEPIAARSVGAAERAWLWCRKRPALMGLLSALVLVLIAASGILVAYARQQAELARQQADRAHTERLLRVQAIAERDRAGRQAYVNAINLAWNAWQDGNPARVRDLLKSTSPSREGHVDFRGFEWSYLDQLDRTALWTFAPKDTRSPSIAFSPDGAWIAVARNNGSDRKGDIALLDARTGREIRTIAAKSASFSGIALSPNGAWIASTRDDRSVVIWESRGGAEIMSLPGDQVSKAMFSRDGRLLATLVTQSSPAGANAQVKIWDLAKRQAIQSLVIPSYAYNLAFSPDGKLLATAAGGLQVWDTLTGQVVWKTGNHAIMTDVAFSPDGKLLAAASFDGWIGLWDATTGVRGATLSGHRGEVQRLAFSPDGQRLASGGRDRIVRIWDIQSNRLQLELRGHESIVWDLAFSPDGGRLASVSFLDGVVKLWDTRQRQEAIELGQPATGDLTFGLAYSADGRLLTAAQSAGHLQTWDVVRRSSLNQLDSATKTGRSWVAFSPRSDLLATLDEKRSIVLRNPMTGALLRAMDSSEGSGRCCGAFSPDGRFLAATSGTLSAIRIWDVSTGQLIAVLPGHKGDIECLAFSPDGRTLASGSLDTTVRIWDFSSRREQLVYRGHSQGIACVAFSPDGKRLASAQLDSRSPGEIQLWDVSTGQSQGILRGHAGFARRLSYLDDGRRLASLGDDGQLKIWDVQAGQETLSLPAHTRNGIAMAASPNGRQIATSGAEGSVLIWDATKSAANPDGPG
jgi:WD40 repeat protein/tRNA A-37 threonylcarbamoyl transferase component Bud32